MNDEEIIDKKIEIRCGGEVVLFYRIPILGLNKYVISKCGLIYSLHSNKNRIINAATDKDGYKVLTLRRYNKPYYIKLHRLLALTFIGPCPEGFVCNHKNTIKDDNSIDNLEWVSQKQNYHHSKNINGKDYYNPIKWTGEKHGLTKLSDSDAITIRTRFKKIKESQKQISLRYKVSPSCIGRLLRNETFKHILGV